MDRQPLVTDAETLPPSQVGAQRTGDDDQAHGGERADPPADLDQQHELDRGDDDEEEEKPAHRRILPRCPGAKTADDIAGLEICGSRLVCGK